MPDPCQDYGRGAGIPPRFAVIQLGYVVRAERFDDCIAFWRDTMGGGPFYLGEMQLDDQLFRGEPTAASVAVAICYLGDTQIEIIKQTNDAPSPYLEWLDQHPTIPRGGLLHHHMIAGGDYDVAVDSFARNGIRPSFTATIASRHRLAYLDATRSLGCFVEVMDRDHPFRDLFELMRRQTAAWDGRDPIFRQVSELMTIPGA